MKQTFSFLIACLWLLVLAGCNSSNGGPGTPTLAAITVTPANAAFPLGTSQAFTATAVMSNGSTQALPTGVTWTISAPSGATSPGQATVNGTGLVQSTASGPILVTASVGNVSGSAPATITAAALVSLAVTPPAATAPVGIPQQFEVFGTYTDHSTVNLTNGNAAWSIAAPSGVVGLPPGNITNGSASYGLATGAGVGTYLVQASFGGLTSPPAFFKNTTAVLTSIAVTPAAQTIPNGTTLQYKATGKYSDGSTQDITQLATWAPNASTFPPSLAILSNSPGSIGLATGNAVGSVNVQATLGTVSGSTLLTISPAILDSIAVSPLTGSIPAGSTLQYQAWGTYSDHSQVNLTSSVSWATTPGVATVSTDPGSFGLAKGVAAGQTYVTASLGPVSSPATAAQLTVTAPALAQIAITPAAYSVPKGLTVQYKATGIYTDTSTQDLTTQVAWGVTAGTGTAGMSGLPGMNGLATGTGVGSVTVTAALGSISGATPLTVTAATLTSLSIAPTQTQSGTITTYPQIPAGLSQQFTVTGTFSDTSTQNLTSAVAWTSTGFLSVSMVPGTYGIVRADNQGAGSIGSVTATYTSGTTSIPVSTQVQITGAVLSSISISPIAESIAAGQTESYTVTGMFSDLSTETIPDSQVLWTESNSAVASIDDPAHPGVATGLNQTGETTIYASYQFGSQTFQTNTTLFVSSASLTSLSVAPASTSVYAGVPTQFHAYGKFSNNQTYDLSSFVSWTIPDSTPPIASVTPMGVVTGDSAGNTTVTAQFGTLQGSSSVQVNPAYVTSITVNPPNPQIALGTSQQFTATGYYSDGSSNDISAAVVWQTLPIPSSNPVLAAGITTAGLATGAAPGQATVQATLSGGPGGSVSGSTTLSVTSATLTSLAVTPAAPTLANGATQQFTATGTFSDTSTQDLTSSVTWSLANNTGTSALVPNAKGLLTAGGVGSAVTVNATYGSGASAVPGSANVAVSTASLLNISIDQSAQSIAATTYTQFTAKAHFSDGSSQDITTNAACAWSINPISGNPGSALIGTPGSTPPTTPGLAYGLTAGQVTVQAVYTVSGQNYPATATLFITGATLVGLSVEPNDTLANPLVLASGQQQQFTAWGTFSDSTQQNLTSLVTWNPGGIGNIITGSTGNNGLFTAGSGGNTGTITASITWGGMLFSASSTVQVTAPVVTGITISPNPASIAAAGTQQFTATTVLSNNQPGTDVTGHVTWSVNPASSYASIAASGLATGSNSTNATQQVTITASYQVGTQAFPASATLFVSSPTLLSLTVNPQSPNPIPEGLTQQFTVSGQFSDNTSHDLTNAVTWSSSAPTIGTISNTSGSNGLFTAGATPNATTNIQAQFGSIMSNVVPMTVNNALGLLSLSISPASQQIPMGGIQTFTVTAYYGNNTSAPVPAGSVTWTSSNPAVAQAPTTGMATGLAAGLTNITATYMGKSVTAELSVNTATLTKLTVAPVSSTTTVYAGQTQQFTATGTFSDNSTEDLTNDVKWTSSDTTVATIGLASGLAQGIANPNLPLTATITATSGAISDSSTLTVDPPALTGILLSGGVQSIAQNATATGNAFTATGEYTNGANLPLNVTWSITNGVNATNGQASITSLGVVTGVTAGDVTVVATDPITHLFATAPLTVTGITLESLAITVPNTTPPSGLVQQLTVTGTFDDHSTEDLTSAVTWNLTNLTSLAINNSIGLNTGLFTAGSPTSESTLTASLDSVFSPEVSITVQGPTLQSIDLSRADPEYGAINAPIPQGTNRQLIATGHYSDGTTHDLTSSVSWGSTTVGNGVTASVNSTGKVLTQIALPQGQTGSVIVSAVQGSVSTAVTIPVNSAIIQSIAVDPYPVVNPFNLHGTLQFNASGTFTDGSDNPYFADITDVVTWNSSSAHVAFQTPGDPGLATAVSAGAATVSATFGATNSPSVAVTVN